MNKLLLIIICLFVSLEVKSNSPDLSKLLFSDSITSIDNFNDKNKVRQYFIITKPQFLKQKYIQKRTSFSYVPCELMESDIKEGFEAMCVRTRLNFFRIGLRFPKGKMQADLVAFNISGTGSLDDGYFEIIKLGLMKALSPEFFTFIERGVDSFGNPSLDIIIEQNKK